MTREHARSSFQSMPTDNHRLKEGNRITWVSIWVNIVLTIMQILVGLWAHSQSLIADAMHTLSDIISDGFVLYANRKSAIAADEAHPYGHGRYETAASLVLGSLLTITGVGILWTAVDRLQHLGNLPPVGAAAMVAALITLAGKESLFRYMLKVAEQLRSPMLVANAWHARADALSSLVVAAGIGGALMGFSFADAVGAIIVGAMIVKAGVRFGWDALQELIDTGLSQEEVLAIRKTLETTPGVLDAHDIRTRRMGHKALVDVHVRVSPRISVSEGHLIGETARNRALKSHAEILDVLVHVDPEDDMDSSRHINRTPSRDALMAHLQALVGDVPLTTEQTVFHYLGRQVEAEIFLPAEIFMNAERMTSLENHLAGALLKDPWFGSVTLNCRFAPN